MKISGFFKFILFLGECVRITALTTTYTFLQPPGYNSFPWIVFAASGALYPLITFFYWFDSGRFKSYVTLYLAGKCVNISSLLGWLIIIKRGTMNVILLGTGYYTGIILLIADILSILIVLLIRKDWMEKTDNQALEEK